MYVKLNLNVISGADPSYLSNDHCNRSHILFCVTTGI